MNKETLKAPEKCRISEIQVHCRDCGMYLESSGYEDGKAEIAVEACQCPLNEIRKVYEKYKDRLNGVDFKYDIMSNLWQAIKVSLGVADLEEK